jgi:hypothetical protein
MEVWAGVDVTFFHFIQCFRATFPRFDKASSKTNFVAPFFLTLPLNACVPAMTLFSLYSAFQGSFPRLWQGFFYQKPKVDVQMTILKMLGSRDHFSELSK